MILYDICFSLSDFILYDSLKVHGVGIVIYTLCMTYIPCVYVLCIKQITGENQLYRAGNSALCGDPNRKELQERGAYMFVCAVVQLCLNTADIPPGSSVHGTSQARTLEWVTISFSRGSSWPRDRTWVSCIGRQILYHSATVICIREKVLVTQPCPTLWPMDCSLPGSSVRGILQARLLEWVAITFSRESSWPRDWTQVCIAGRFFTTEPPGKLHV